MVKQKRKHNNPNQSQLFPSSDQDSTPPTPKAPKVSKTSKTSKASSPNNTPPETPRPNPIPNPRTEIGVQPKPRPTTPPQSIYDVETYQFINSNRIISLPVRPENLDRRGHNQFRNTIKKTVINLESTNHNTVIVYRRDPGWWSCGGNSLLFYKHFLEQEYHLPSVNIRIDNDYGCRWPNSGSCIMIKNVANFVTVLTSRAHATLILETPEVIILELPLSFDDVAIKSFRNIKKNKEDRINSLLTPKVVNPHTRQAIDALNVTIVNRIAKLTAAQRDIYGYMGTDIIGRISYRFISMSNGRIPAEEYYLDTLTEIDNLLEWLAYTQKFNLFNVDELCRIAEQITDTKERINNELTLIRHKREAAEQ